MGHKKHFLPIHPQEQALIRDAASRGPEYLENEIYKMAFINNFDRPICTEREIMLSIINQLLNPQS